MLQAIAPLLGLATVTGTSKVLLDKAMKDRTKREQAEVDAEALAKKAREEARSGGTDAPPTDAMKQTMADEKMKKAAEKAPTTKTEMGKRFKSGGVTRADGCITKGHTKGRMV
jgi:hypothetical protein